MKHLLLIALILISTTVIAQPPAVALLDTTESNIFFKTIPNYQGGGKLDTIRAIVDPGIMTDLRFDATKLFILSLTTNRKAVGTLKEQSSYRVGEKYRIYRVKNEIKYSWEYYGQNAYGAEKKNIIVVTFDEKGVFKGSVVL